MAVSKLTRDRAMKAICGYYETLPDLPQLDQNMLYDRGFPRRKDVRLAIRVLAAMGYLCVFYDNSGYANHIELTKAGKCYFEMQRDEFWRFVRRSILVPILVSFVTAVITVRWPEIVFKIKDCIQTLLRTLQ